MSFLSLFKDDYILGDPLEAIALNRFKRMAKEWDTHAVPVDLIN